MKRVLFVNGINTYKGGAGAYTLKLWTRILSEKSICKTLHITPSTFSNGPAVLYKIYLALVFMPGTLFRALRNPFFEIFYKLSLIEIVVFLREKWRFKPDQIILSHHATFYLIPFITRRKRVLLIHDLLYVRAKSMGFSRAMTKLIFRMELMLYRSSPLVLVSSMQETRLLSSFLRGSARVKVISSYDFPKQITSASSADDKAPDQSLALIADWRRFENVDGVRSFFSKAAEKNLTGPKLQVHIWGYNSETIGLILKEAGLSGIEAKTMGSFDHYSDLKDPFIFVPIFIGAGIKIKVVEAFAHGKGVIGTRAAFIGLPRALLKDIAVRIETMDDLMRVKLNPPPGPAFEKFARGYSSLFENIFTALQV